MREANYDDERWQGIRKVVLETTGGKCRRCGADADDCHHSTYASAGTDTEWLDCIPLCHDCHRFVHGLSTYDPAHEQPTCVDCGWDEEVTLTEDDEPICRECLRHRNTPD